MTKDSLKKHLTSDVHLKAIDLNTKAQLGATSYNQHVLQNTPIGHGLTRMAKKDKEILRVCFNTAYYLVKQEWPFSDYPALLNLQFNNGVKEFQSYRNDCAAAGFTNAVGDVIKDSLVKDLTSKTHRCQRTEGSNQTCFQQNRLSRFLLEATWF